MAYRLTDPNPAYVNLLGEEVLPGGSLTFYDRGTTNPRDTFSDPDMGPGTENENPLPLDSSGRAETEVWLDGEYTVVLKDEDGTTIWSRDVIPEVSEDLTIPDPTGHEDDDLTWNGTSLVWVDRVRLPDGEDSGGQMLVWNSDGTALVNQPIPEAEEANVAITTSKLVLVNGDGSRAWQVLKGVATIPASNANTASLAINFGANKFKDGEVPNVCITPAPGTQPGAPVLPRLGSMATATGFTATIDAAEGSNANQNIVSDAVIQWRAEGEVDPP